MQTFNIKYRCLLAGVVGLGISACEPVAQYEQARPRGLVSTQVFVENVIAVEEGLSASSSQPKKVVNAPIAKKRTCSDLSQSEMKKHAQCSKYIVPVKSKAAVVSKSVVPNKPTVKTEITSSVNKTTVKSSPKKAKAVKRSCSDLSIEELSNSKFKQCQVWAVKKCTKVSAAIKANAKYDACRKWADNVAFEAKS